MIYKSWISFHGWMSRVFPYLINIKKKSNILSKDSKIQIQHFFSKYFELNQNPFYVAYFFSFHFTITHEHKTVWTKANVTYPYEHFVYTWINGPVLVTYTSENTKCRILIRLILIWLYSYHVNELSFILHTIFQLHDPFKWSK